MHLFILEQHPLVCMSNLNSKMKLCVCFLTLVVLWGQRCLCLFLRPNLSRWMRRTRPIPWCRWLPCPRSPSTSPLSMASLHRKMGPTLPPPLTDTPPPRPPWLTRRCESGHPWPPRPTQHPLGRTTHKPLRCLRDCPHTETNSQEPIKIHSPSLFPSSTCGSQDDDNNDEAHDNNDNACNVKRLGSLACAGVKRSQQFNLLPWLLSSCNNPCKITK